MGGHVPPSKNSRPLSKEKYLSRGGCQNVSPNDKYRKKLNVFYTWSLWVQTAAVLSSILFIVSFSKVHKMQYYNSLLSCSHYGFFRKLVVVVVVIVVWRGISSKTDGRTKAEG